MKNNFYFRYFITLIFCLLYPFNTNAEQFDFKIKEIEVLNNGNLFKGYNRGIIETDSGIIIKADNFIYDKIANTIDASGKVEIEDINNNYKIFTNKISYQKNEEIIFTKGNSRAIDNTGKIISANDFVYKKSQNILNAKKNVNIKDSLNDYELYSDEITYYKDEQKLLTTGKTEAIIESTYNIKSKDLLFLVNTKILSSEKKTTIKDLNSNIYFLEKFLYSVDDGILKGKNITTISNYNLPKSDKAYFSEAIINLKKNSFAAKDPKIEFHNDVFANKQNNPRIYGISSVGNKENVVINKAVFTSCKKNDDCPPWSIQAEKIEHNKEKRQINYKNAFLNIYNIPVLYFPKFFHPDPTVERQSGLLKPTINNSNILGSSLTVPYFNVISDNKDLTITPSWFDKKIFMLQNEYREVKKKSKFIADFGFVNGYKSTLDKKKIIYLIYLLIMK